MKSKYLKYLLLASLMTVFTASCSNPLKRNFGTSVRRANGLQLVTPQSQVAAEQPPVDGQVSEAVMDNYYESYSEEGEQAGSGNGSVLGLFQTQP